jgi:hypothetical protein
MHPEEIGLQDLESLFLCLYFKHATDVMEKKRGLRCRFTKQWIVMCNAELEDVVLLKLSGFGLSVLLLCILSCLQMCDGEGEGFAMQVYRVVACYV